ncbi:MAG: hypothetical protein LBQ66_10820 [Planctomycetaceae bacterium]|nr:hypothetical protein [Planctomycetaceae bacterium]
MWYNEAGCPRSSPRRYSARSRASQSHVDNILRLLVNNHLFSQINLSLSRIKLILVIINPR